MQPKPQVGDIWRDISFEKGHWLIVDKYINKEKNTHYVVLRHLIDNRKTEWPAVYLRAKWEFIA